MNGDLSAHNAPKFNVDHQQCVSTLMDTINGTFHTEQYATVNLYTQSTRLLEKRFQKTAEPFQVKTN